MICNKKTQPYEHLRLFFEGLVGLLVDPTQINPDDLCVFVSIAQDDETSLKSPLSYPIRLSQADSSVQFSSSRRYVAIWHEDNPGIVIKVKPDQVLCLQICVHFASGSSLALGCCKWRFAQKGNKDLIVKHYKQEGAAIHIDPKGDAMLRLHSNDEVASVSSTVARGQMPALPPPPKDTPVRKLKKKRIMTKCADEDYDTSSSSSVLSDCMHHQALRWNSDDSSTITIRHRNSSTCADTDLEREESREWKNFDTPDCFRDSENVWSWFKMSKKSRGVDSDKDDKMRLPPRPPKTNGHKTSIVLFDTKCGLDVLGTSEDDSTSDSSLFSSGSDEYKEDEHSQRVSWKSGFLASSILNPP